MKLKDAAKKIQYTIDAQSKEIAVLFLNAIRKNMPEFTGSLINSTSFQIGKQGNETIITIKINEEYAKTQDLEKHWHVPGKKEKRITSYYNSILANNKKVPIYRRNGYTKAYWALRKAHKLGYYAYNYSERSFKQIEPIALDKLKQKIRDIIKRK